MKKTTPETTDAMVARVAKERHKVRTPNGTTEMTTEEAIFRKEVETATRGSPLAQRAALQRMHDAVAREAARVEEECKKWTRFKEIQAAKLAAAKKAGPSAPRVLPHPEDIIIDPETGGDCIGPWDEDHYARCFHARVSLLEALMFQQALEYHLDPVEFETGKLDGALVVALVVNRSLPPSLRKDENVMFWRIDVLSRHSKRWLLKETRAAWQRAGSPRPRGHRFPLRDHIVALIGAVSEHLKRKAEAGDDPKALDRVYWDFAVAIAEALSGRSHAHLEMP